MQGKEQKAHAESKAEASKAKQAAGGHADNTKGGVKEMVGKVTGNDKQKAEGKADQAHGDAAKKKANIL
jgi:uncharacterized protein YjbJ (UPF0337 family)